MISNKCYYALKAVLELSLRGDERPLSIAHIARAQSIPARFLEGILRELKQGGFVDSLRGKEGGYILAAPPEKLTVGRIIQMFEGNLTCSSPDADPPGALRPFEQVWEKAAAAISGVLDKTTFAEMAAHFRDLAPAQHEDYSI